MANLQSIAVLISLCLLATVINAEHALMDQDMAKDRRANLDNFLSQLKSEAALAGRMRFGKRAMYGYFEPLDESQQQRQQQQQPNAARLRQAQDES